MKLVSRMSGLASRMRSRSSALSCPVYPANVGQAGLVEELVEFLALAVGERVHRIDHDRPRAAHFAGARARITASMIGMKKQSDFPEPVPVVTAKLCRAIAFATACI